MPYIQIDNEPMNHKLSPDQYAAIVNLYGPRPREIAPQPRVVACGQKRSNDMNWSKAVERGEPVKGQTIESGSKVRTAS